MDSTTLFFIQCSLPTAFLAWVCERRLRSVNPPLLRWRQGLSTAGRIQLGLAVLSIVGILFGYWCDSDQGDSIRDFFMFRLGPASLCGLMVSLVWNGFL